jgi:hypothetical protein
MDVHIFSAKAQVADAPLSVCENAVSTEYQRMFRDFDLSPVR